eukprot:8078438-Pyramimonas_sp.AAC.1
MWPCGGFTCGHSHRAPLSACGRVAGSPAVTPTAPPSACGHVAQALRAAGSQHARTGGSVSCV